MATATFLKSLRLLMSKHVPPLSAYIVPSADAHNSGYLAARDTRRAFISGFTGSAGTAIVTAKNALVWTDGRYYLQAEKEMDSNWTLMKEGLPEVPSRQDWLANELPPGSKVGVDPILITKVEYEGHRRTLEAKGVEIISVGENLVDKVWNDQPNYPENRILPLETKFAGASWESKIDMCRVEMAKEGVDVIILSALDDVAYLLNLRGSDIKYNPVFFAYVAVSKDSVHLFVSDNQVSPDVKKHLSSKNKTCDVNIRPYGEIHQFLDNLGEDERVWFSNTASMGLTSLVQEKNCHVAVTCVTHAKAIKNTTELQGFVNCHIRDAAALCSYFTWLEKVAPGGQETEISGAKKLAGYRAEMELFVGLSFDTISGMGPNGAVIHYSPAEATNRNITTEEMYLVDSGGQYKDGTTDVTRTMHFGTPSQHMKECFTRVLKGHIKLDSMIFPDKLKGVFLDSFARASLWEVGLDYGHGTGHGVGSYLNVHEGPSGISFRVNLNDPGIQEGMIMSNEPGYYEEGQFGIRIENLVQVVKANTRFNFNKKQYLTFEPVTLVPIQTKLMDPELMSRDEIDWVNNYHNECREKVGPLLRELGKKDALKWLMKETEALG